MDANEIIMATEQEIAGELNLLPEEEIIGYLQINGASLDVLMELTDNWEETEGEVVVKTTQGTLKLKAEGMSLVL